MIFLAIFSAQAIGPVWPAMLLYFVYMAATTIFVVLAHFRSWLRSFSLREHRFLQRLYDATEMFSTLAILSGMIGTCLGLLEVLPVFSKTLAQSGQSQLLGEVTGPLRNVWASTIAGLALGGLWGEILLFVLKPYTRPALLPLSTEDPPANASDFEPDDDLSPDDDLGSDDRNIDDDWRQHNHQGIY